MTAGFGSNPRHLQSPREPGTRIMDSQNKSRESRRDFMTRVGTLAAGTVLSRAAVAPALAAADEARRDSGKDLPPVAKGNHERRVTLLSTLYPDETDYADPAEGQRIVHDIRAADAGVRLSAHGITLTWPPNLDALAPGFINRIRAARTAVARALGA